MAKYSKKSYDSADFWIKEKNEIGPHPISNLERDRMRAELEWAKAHQEAQRRAEEEHRYQLYLRTKEMERLREIMRQEEERKNRQAEITQASDYYNDILAAQEELNGR